MGGSNADVMREVAQAFNERNSDRVKELVTDGCEFVDVAAGQTSRGPDEIAATFRMWADAFSDMEIQTLNVVATGNGAVGEFLGRGTHDGPLPSPGGEIPPTGKRLEEQFLVIAEIDGGKLTGFREYYDAMTMMAQLGLMPEPAQA
jgi:predicted ester cyclase